jgi:hypothetical protein
MNTQELKTGAQCRISDLTFSEPTYLPSATRPFSESYIRTPDEFAAWQKKFIENYGDPLIEYKTRFSIIHSTSEMYSKACEIENDNIYRFYARTSRNFTGD